MLVLVTGIHDFLGAADSVVDEEDVEPVELPAAPAVWPEEL